MVEIKIESINKEDVNLEDILSEIAKEINKGKITGDTIQWDYRDKTLDNDKNALKSLEEMKKELIMHSKIVDTLDKKIKEEEARIKKNENHLIEKKVKTISVSEKVLIGTSKEEYRTVTKKPFQRKEVVKYVRKENQIICTITNDFGVFQGVAAQHPEDKFNYEDGMTLAMIRAKKDMYAKIELDLLECM